MAKLTKDFIGVPDGAIYPVQYRTGDEVPAELVDAARSLGVIAEKEETTKKMVKSAPENKMVKTATENKAK